MGVQVFQIRSICQVGWKQQSAEAALDGDSKACGSQQLKQVYAVGLAMGMVHPCAML